MGGRKSNTGAMRRRSPGRVSWESDSKYCDNLKHDYGMQKCGTVPTPITREVSSECAVELSLIRKDQGAHGGAF